MNDLFGDVERFRDVIYDSLDSRKHDDAAYAELRARLLADDELNRLLPPCFRDCRSLEELRAWLVHLHPCESVNRLARDRVLAVRRDEVRALLSNALCHAESAPRSPLDGSVTAALKALDATRGAALWAKTIERCKADPSGAVTTANALLEDVCKQLLDRSAVPYAQSDNTRAMLHKLLNAAGRHPTQVAEKHLKAIGQCCGTLTSIVADVRGEFGDAHGQGTSPRPELDPASAALVVNVAGSVAVYLLSVFEIGP